MKQKPHICTRRVKLMWKSNPCGFAQTDQILVGLKINFTCLGGSWNEKKLETPVLGDFGVFIAPVWLFWVSQHI